MIALAFFVGLFLGSFAAALGMGLAAAARCRDCPLRLASKASPNDLSP